MSNQYTKLNIYLASELLFVLLPLIILSIIRLLDNDLNSIFYNIEWSVAALILFGQSLIRFTTGLSKTTIKMHWQVVAFCSSIVLVLGLIPVAIILVYITLANETSFMPHLLQIILFVFSILSFFLIGGVGQSLLDEN